MVRFLRIYEASINIQIVIKQFPSDFTKNVNVAALRYQLQKNSQIKENIEYGELLYVHNPYFSIIINSFIYNNSTTNNILQISRSTTIKSLY